jgi:hypothetical protein
MPFNDSELEQTYMSLIGSKSIFISKGKVLDHYTLDIFASGTLHYFTYESKKKRKADLALFKYYLFMDRLKKSFDDEVRAEPYMNWGEPHADLVGRDTFFILTQNIYDQIYFQNQIGE